jgi:hypothetical protein
MRPNLVHGSKNACALPCIGLRPNRSLAACLVKHEANDCFAKGISARRATGLRRSEAAASSVNRQSRIDPIRPVVTVGFREGQYRPKAHMTESVQRFQ